MGPRRGARLIAALLPSGALLFLVAGLSAQQGAKSETTKPDGAKLATQAPAPAQPVPFSHKTHTSLQLPCQFCHPNPDPGNQMMLPAAAKCMTCHAGIAKDKPAIKKLTEFATRQETIPWVRFYSVPAFVYWSHRTHLEAKMTCEMCHGRVAQMDVLIKVTNVTTMGGCVDCHKHNGAGSGCVICHEGLISQYPYRANRSWMADSSWGPFVRECSVPHARRRSEIAARSVRAHTQFTFAPSLLMRGPLMRSYQPLCGWRGLPARRDTPGQSRCWCKRDRPNQNSRW
jgi:hypothetical protein